MPGRDDEPKQKTEKGLEIPVPKRADWDRVLDKVVPKSPRPARGERDQADDD
jgi:hypothetical protein